jgi:hypothetical protein
MLRKRRENQTGEPAANGKKIKPMPEKKNLFDFEGMSDDQIGRDSSSVQSIEENQDDQE